MEHKDLGYTLIYYINTLPEGHVLREIAERTLVDFNKREMVYVTAETNDSHRGKKRSPPLRKQRPPLKELQSILTQNLRYLRSKTKLTQGAFARELGITRDGLNNIELGKVKPPLDFLLKVSDRYNYTIEFLITELVKNHKN